MIQAWKLSEKGAKEVHPEEVRTIHGHWLGVSNPSGAELSRIQALTGVTSAELRLCLDLEERPKLLGNEKYALVIFSAPVRKSDRVLTESFGTFLGAHWIMTVNRDPIPAVQEFLNQPEKQRQEIIKQGSVQILYELLSRTLNQYFSIMDTLEDEIDNIENEVIRQARKSHVHRVFLLKKTLTFFHKSLNANREVIMEIEKGYAKQIPKKAVEQFRMLYYDVTQLIDVEAVYRDVLTGILDTYLTSVSNSLNEVMKKLTVYASYILVPTLISGIYGMNFRFMPELLWPYGYAFALGLMVFSVVALHFFFKRKGWA